MLYTECIEEARWTMANTYPANQTLLEGGWGRNVYPSSKGVFSFTIINTVFLKRITGTKLSFKASRVKSAIRELLVISQDIAHFLFLMSSW